MKSHVGWCGVLRRLEEVANVLIGALPHATSSSVSTAHRSVVVPRVTPPAVDLVPSHCSVPDVECGVPVKVVSKMLGHASSTITLATYAYVVPGMAEEAGPALRASLLGRAVTNW